MGVTGLWQLLEPAGKPISLESLEGKILAIDVSLWLHQSIRGASDYQHTVKNPHLVSLFNRVAKLLYYRVKPVFVFDGPNTPVFKQRTLAQRKLRRDLANEKVSKIRRKILLNHAHQLAYGIGSLSSTNFPNKRPPLPRNPPESDIFEIPVEMPLLSNSDEEDTKEIIEDGNFSSRDSHNSSFSDIDLKSEQFRSLPLEIQHDLLLDMQETKKTRVSINELPLLANEFSSFQLNRLLNKNQLTRTLHDVKQQMAASRGMLLLEDYGVSVSDPQVKEKIMDYLKHSQIEILPESRDTCNILINSDDLDGLPGFGLFSSCNTEKTGSCSQSTDASSPMYGNLTAVLNSERLLRTQISNDSSSKDRGGVTCVGKSPQICTDTEYGVLLPKSNDNTTRLIDPVQSWCEKGDLFVYPVPASGRKIDAKLKNNSENNKLSLQHLQEENVQNNTCEGSLEHASSEVDSRIGIHCDAVHALSTADSQLPFDTKDVTISSVTSSKLCTESKIMDNDAQQSYLTDTTVADQIVASPRYDRENLECEENAVGLPGVVSAGASDDNYPEMHASGVTVSDGETDGEDFEDVEDNDVVPSTSGFSGGSHSYSGIIDDDHGEQVEIDSFALPSTSDVQTEQARLTNEHMQHDLQTEMNNLTSSLTAERNVAATITDQVYKDCQALLGLLGVPYVISAGEAEAQCAWLEQTKLVHGTVTDDSDIWLFGGRKVYKNLFNRNRHVLYYTIEDVTRKLGLSRLQLIQLAFLSGCDYFAGLDGIGIVHGIEIISEFHQEGDQKLEALSRFRDWLLKSGAEVAESRNCSPTKMRLKRLNIDLPDGFPNEHILNAYMNPDVDNSRERFSWSRPDLQLLRDFCSDYMNWSEQKVNEIMLPIMQRISASERNQLRITCFTTSIDFKRFEEAMPAKRLGKALKKLKGDPGAQTNKPDDQMGTTSKCKNGAKSERLDEQRSIGSKTSKLRPKKRAKRAKQSMGKKVESQNGKAICSANDTQSLLQHDDTNTDLSKYISRAPMFERLNSDISVSDDELLEILARTEGNGVKKIIDSNAAFQTRAEPACNIIQPSGLDFTETKNGGDSLNATSADDLAVPASLPGSSRKVVPSLKIPNPSQLRKITLEPVNNRKRVKRSKMRKPNTRSRNSVLNAPELSESESD